MRITPPGDDVVPVPPPLDESPPYDRFCDLVTTGGVASGVVYPWAIVEIARAYRFRSIGGTSVGAMAAALAAAAEYGRRTGNDRAFEPLRRLPGALGEALADGRTRMLSLFQTNPRGRRLIDLLARLGAGGCSTMREPDPAFEPRWMLRGGRARAPCAWARVDAGVCAAFVGGRAGSWPRSASSCGGVTGLTTAPLAWLRALLLVVACSPARSSPSLCALWGDVKKG